MPFHRTLSVIFVLLVGTAVLPAQVVIDHRYTNTDAQSLIGLPMGSHKTIVDKQGDLKWSQWSLKRKPLDTPIGFSDQMDGELAIQAFAGTDPLKVSSQQLYRGTLSVHRLFGNVRQSHARGTRLRRRSRCQARRNPHRPLRRKSLRRSSSHHQQ